MAGSFGEPMQYVETKEKLPTIKKQQPWICLS